MAKEQQIRIKLKAYDNYVVDESARKEIVVTAIQAYIFTILSALYFGMATEEAHH